MMGLLVNIPSSSKDLFIWDKIDFSCSSTNISYE